MIAQERAPALTARATIVGHVLGDCRLCHGEPKLEQLTMNPRCTPKPIFNAHLPDQCPQICGDLRPTSHLPRFPTPVATKSRTLPAHHGAFSASSELLGLNNDAPRLKRKNISATIAADVKRFCHQIKKRTRFSVHTREWPGRLDH